MITKKTNRYNFISLFSGCGGFDLGFMWEGFKCIGAFDIDPIAIDVHKKNLSSPAYVCDLSKDSFFIDPVEKPHIVISGPPCQGFSTNGKRRLDDPRNHLLLKAGEIAIKLAPEVIVFENVIGVTSGKHKIFWDTLIEMFFCAGYKSIEMVCEAWKFGVSQTRKRKVLFAYKGEKNIKLPDQINHETCSLKTVLKDLDKNIPNHEIKMIPKKSKLELIAKKIRPGQKLSNVRGGPRSVHTWDIPEVFGKTTFREKMILEMILKMRRRNRVRNFGDADPVSFDVLRSELKFPIKKNLISLERKGYIRRINGFYDLTHTFNGKFRRLSWNGLSPTVHTRFGDPRFFLHPEENRGFTVREAARIQGFPDSFLFMGKDTDQYRLIGNAIPPPIASYLAFLLRNIIIN